MTQTIDRDVTTLRAAMSGAVLLPGDEGYGEARSVWNGDIDRRPAVSPVHGAGRRRGRAARYAQDAGLEVAVRRWARLLGSSHRRGRVGDRPRPDRPHRRRPGRPAGPRRGGAKLGRLDAATQAHGLAVPAGTVSHTGVGGLTLGGGWGWFSRMHGLTIDNLESAQVVLADGRCVTASATEHPDLFWALRGEGGNFGVVTEFEFGCTR